MPDTQTLLDRGYTPTEILRIRSCFNPAMPASRVRLSASTLNKAPVLDACNHAR